MSVEQLVFMGKVTKKERSFVQSLELDHITLLK